MSSDYKPENKPTGNIFGVTYMEKPPSDEDGHTPLIEG